MKRKSTRRRNRELTARQQWELILGPAGESAFYDDQERHISWEDHRGDSLMQFSKRCWAWWHYDAPEPRRIVGTQHLQALLVPSESDRDIDVYEEPIEALCRWGLATADELAELRRRVAELAEHEHEYAPGAPAGYWVTCASWEPYQRLKALVAGLDQG